jgi:hypothetical protein
MSGIGWPEFSIYVFCSLFALAVFVFIFMPSADKDTGEEKTRLTYLYERKDVIYDNLRDLNFEYKSGKFTQADFESMRGNMEAEAARVLAEIDQLESVTA